MEVIISVICALVVYFFLYREEEKMIKDIVKDKTEQLRLLVIARIRATSYSIGFGFIIFITLILLE